MQASSLNLNLNSSLDSQNNPFMNPQMMGQFKQMMQHCMSQMGMGGMMPMSANMTQPAQQESTSESRQAKTPSATRPPMMPMSASGQVGDGSGVLQQQSVTRPAQEHKGNSVKSGEDAEGTAKTKSVLDDFIDLTDKASEEEDRSAGTLKTVATEREESDPVDKSPSSTDDESDTSDEIAPNFNQIQDDETRIAHEKMKAFRSKTFEHDKQLPSNLCKKSVQNDPKKFKSYSLQLPNKENVKVIKLLGEGAYAATYHVKYKGKDCALKVQLTSEDDKADSLAMEFDYQLDLMYRVDQELGIIPIPLELHAFTNGSLFFMSLENGKTLHHIATGPTLSLGVLVYLADLMLSTVVTLHSKGHSVSGSDDIVVPCIFSTLT